MLPLLLCLALAALPAFGEQPGATLAPIAIYTQFQQEPPAAVLDALQNEVESIMSPMGLHFEWRSLPSASGSEVSIELAVVNFKGRCDIAGLPPDSTNPGPLGWTHVSDGVILPFADVDCESLRGFLGKELLKVRAAERKTSFGRALGRVLAHELYHIFANTLRHGADGVGKPAYTVRELLSTDFRFEEKEALALKTSKAHIALQIGATPINP
jgi:hypothetical protein